MATHTFPRRTRFSAGFMAGLLAGGIASGLMLLLSITLDGISLPEVLGSTVTGLMGPETFQYFHRLFGENAKHYLFIIILAGQCLVFALYGGLCNLLVDLGPLRQARDEQGQLHWFVAPALALVLWLGTGLLLLPATRAGIFGAQLTIGIANTMFSLAVVGLLFGLLFVLFQNKQIQKRLQAQQRTLQTEDATMRRRTLLWRGVGILGAGVLGVMAWRFISSAGGPAVSDKASLSPLQRLVKSYKEKITPVPTPNYGTFPEVPNLSPEVISNEDFYIVSKNLFSDPTVDGKKWKLTVHGDVERPFVLDYTELMKLPTKEQHESLMCISNEVGGKYMGNALWEGFPLADLLNRAGVKPDATKIVLRAADDYSDSIHLSKAMEPTTMVAVRMNGATLPAGHGFPARLLVPGIYGMKHVKWITSIEVVNYDFKGYWQERGWSDPAPVRMTARIDTPLDGMSLAANKTRYIAGVAFSGNKGISQVDVSVDGGETWQKAVLKRPQSQITWVLWEVPWQPGAGKYTIIARAIDLEGNVQTPYPAPPAPDGSTGYHTINVTVLS